MVVGNTFPSISKTEIFNKVSESQVISAIFPEIKSLPCLINSPLRDDRKPSFSIYVTNNGHIMFKDHGNGDKGSLLDLLCKYWDCTFNQALDRICKMFISNHEITIKPKQIKTFTRKEKDMLTKLQVTVRPWRDYDYEYWESYGISRKWLKYADIHPISHKIITKKEKLSDKGKKYIFPADKYGYCFIERKDNRIQLKIYQPYNTKGFKWCSKMDSSVWGLWTKIPKEGDKVIIGSSVKDCLNIWSQLGIPAVCMQGEGYNPKPQVIEELKRRFKKVIVFFDNDFGNDSNPGRTDSMKIANEYGLYRIEIPAEYKAKDPSDLYKAYGKEKYLEIMGEILKDFK